MKLNVFIILILIMVGISSCSLNTGSVMVDQPSYIKLVGDFENVVMKIDNEEDIIINPESPKNMLFQHLPGVHMITLSRNNKVILKKQILLESGQTTEVLIP